MDVLYDKYQNVLLAMGPKYKNWQLVDTAYNKTDFEKQMKIDKYIIHLYYYAMENKFIYVVLFHHYSPHLEKTDMFKRFLDLLIVKVHKNNNDKKRKFLEKYLDEVNKNKSRIVKILNADKTTIEAILITKKELTTYCVRGIKSKNDKIKLIVQNYLHRHFLVEMSKGPLCGLHTVLSKQEADYLCSQQIMSSRSKLPHILVSDPQLVWCNAKIGDIIKININTELTGKGIQYRVVASSSGKIQSVQFDELEVEEDDLEAEYTDEDKEAANEEDVEVAEEPKETNDKASAEDFADESEDEQEEPDEFY